MELVFLDACILIYWIELKQPYYKSFIEKLESIYKQYPDAELVVSRLSLLECCVAPLRDKQEKILQAYDDFFSDPSINIVELSAEVIKEATIIRANTNINTPDAIQAACAFSCKKLSAFITNDKSFKKIKGLPVHLI